MSAIPDHDAPPPQGGFQRTPPYSMEAEISVLGSMMLSADAIAEVSQMVAPDDFYRGAHRTMFEAMRDLYDRGEPVDTVTLADELERRGKLADVGGALAIADVSAQVPTPANATYYARMVSDRALKRRLIEAGSTLTQLGFDPQRSGEEAVDEAEARVFELANKQRKGDFVPMRDLLSQAFDLIEQLHESDNTITGLETGFSDFDELTSGLQPGQLVILAARPAMGKCLVGSTRVWDATTGRMAPIDSLVREGAAGARVLAHDFDTVSAVAAPVTGVFDNGVRDVVRVTTKSGRTFTSTPNHRVRTLRGWVEVGNLDLAVDAMAIPTRLPEPSDPTRMKEEEVRLLAYLLGDGSTAPSAGANVAFTNAGHEALEDFARSARALGDEVRVVRARTHAAGADQVRVIADRSTLDDLAAAAGVSVPTVRAHLDGRSVRPATAAAVDRACDALAWRADRTAVTTRLVEAHGLRHLAVDKRVPEAVFSLPNDQLATFIGCLWATDGWVTEAGVGPAEIGFASASEQLARDVAHLLLRFGIVARIDHKPNDHAGAWTVAVRDADQVIVFATTFVVPDKQDKARRLAAHVASVDGGRAEVHTFPVAVWDLVDAARPAGLSWPELFRRAGLRPDKQQRDRTRRPTRLRVRALAEALGDPHLLALADGAVGWDPVVAVEPAGRERTYDIEVTPHHNFVADDVVVHNSTLVTNMVSNVAAGQREPVVFFSLEMSQMEIVQRMLSAEAKLDSDRLRTGKLRQEDWRKLSRAIGKLSEAPLFIDDTPGITMMEIRSKCRRIAQRHGLKMVIVDYLQLMESHKSSDGRVQEVAEFSRGLKVLAKELGCPVIALSQLSRKPEERTDRRPVLSDLRESGAIEQDADIVGFIYRDEVYNPDTEAKGEAELIIAKHRAGRLATIRLSFLGHHSRFANIARAPHSAGPPGGHPADAAGAAPPPPGAF